MFIFRYTVEDADTDKASIELAFTGDPDLPTNLLKQAVLDVWAIIAPMVNGELVYASYAAPVDISGVVTASSAISDVQEKALFTFGTLNSNLLHITIPTFIETFFINSGAGKTVDLSLSAVVAFTTLFNGDGLFVDDAYSPDSIYPVNSHGDEAFGTVKAVQKWGR